MAKLQWLQQLYRQTLIQYVPLSYGLVPICIPGFLENINNMLTSGMVPALYPDDEKESIIGGVSCYLDLTVIAPITTNVVYFYCLLKCCRSFLVKQCRPRSDCSSRSSLIWVYTVCIYTYISQ